MEAEVNTEKDEVVYQVINTKEALEEGKNTAMRFRGARVPRQ